MEGPRATLCRRHEHSPSRATSFTFQDDRVHAAGSGPGADDTLRRGRHWVAIRPSAGNNVVLVFDSCRRRSNGHSSCRRLRPSRLADQSHLVNRLSWLGRYGTAAFLLCVSTFLGGMAGVAVPTGSAQQVADTLYLLIGAVGIYAIQAAIVILLTWLTIDVKRQGVDRRRAGFRRSVNYVVGQRAASACNHPAVTRWIIALTSPLLVSLAAVTAIVTMFLHTAGSVS